MTPEQNNSSKTLYRSKRQDRTSSACPPTTVHGTYAFGEGELIRLSPMNYSLRINANRGLLWEEIRKHRLNNGVFLFYFEGEWG